MDRKVKIGISVVALTLIVYFLTRKKNNKEVAQSIDEPLVNSPKFEGLNSNEEEYFLMNDDSDHIRIFKENINRIGINRFGDQECGGKPCGIVHENFMAITKDLIQNPKISDGDKLSVDFVKDFNILIGNIIIPDFKYVPNFPKIEFEEDEVIKKGDRSTEISILKQSINTIIGTDYLRVNGNYDGKLYDQTSEIFKGTSIYSNKNKDGQISKQFIINFNNLIKNQQK